MPKNLRLKNLLTDTLEFAFNLKRIGKPKLNENLVFGKVANFQTIIMIST